MLQPLVPKFRSDLSFRFKDIAENQVPVKLKPIVTPGDLRNAIFGSGMNRRFEHLTAKICKRRTSIKEYQMSLI